MTHFPKPAPTLALTALLLLVHGCAAPPPTRPVARAPAPAPTSAPAPAARVTPAESAAQAPAPVVELPGRRATAVDVERDWLLSWFGGTPVVIAQRGDGLLGVDVPREFCFDANRSQVKPALAAVLDKVAESLRRTRGRLPVLAAPGDAAAPAALALQRATQLRSHLLQRGVPAAQLGAPSATEAAAVQLRMDLSLQ